MTNGRIKSLTSALSDQSVWFDCRLAKIALPEGRMKRSR
jgi:hypothetical protein